MENIVYKFRIVETTYSNKEIKFAPEYCKYSDDGIQSWNSITFGSNQFSKIEKAQEHIEHFKKICMVLTEVIHEIK